MTPDRQLTYVKLSAAGLIGFGALNLIVLIGPLSGLMDAFIDLVHLPFDGAEGMRSPDGRLWIGISGGLLAGWGVVAWQVASKVWPGDPALARSILLPGYLVWFALDSAGSIAAGAGFNAVVNVGILALFALPLRSLPATQEA
ncbi:MAG: excinuclease ABC subunit A [Pseudomonadota bacterium]